MGNYTEASTILRNSGNGRRLHRRYPVDLGIQCRRQRSDEVILGRIRDISSGGVRFMSSEILAPGTKVEFSIDWPVLLDHACHLQLKCKGCVRRSDEYGTAIEIKHHEFHTRKTQTTIVYAAAANI